MDFISSKLTARAQKETLGTEQETMGEDLHFTASEQRDEKALYQELNERLGELETSVEVNENEVESIRRLAADFRLHMDEYKEVLMRVDWLDRLYRVKKQLAEIADFEEAARLSLLLAPVQSCPLKTKLLASLQSFERANQESLMDLALKEAGEEFINLGKTGREFVIAKAGEAASIAEIRESAQKLERSVAKTSQIKAAAKLVEALDNLPLKSFKEFSALRKAEVAAKLAENSEWSGLASLDREIAKVNKFIDEKEAEQEKVTDTIAASKIQGLIQE